MTDASMTRCDFAACVYNRDKSCERNDIQLNRTGHCMNARLTDGDLSNKKSLDITVKQYLDERKANAKPRPDIRTMMKHCVHCRKWVQDFVKAGRGSFAQAVAALDDELDTLYGENETMSEPKKEETNPLEAVVKEMASRMDAMEKEIASFRQTKKDEAPTPAPQEHKEQECPPGMSFDAEAGKCVETQPAPAEQKAVEGVPKEKADSIKVERLIQETVHKMLAEKEKGQIVSETPRPELAKEEQDKMGNVGDRIPSQKEFAEQRNRRRGNALI